MDFAIHHAAVSVIDMAEPVSFYEQLGFGVELHWKDPGGDLEIAHLKLADTLLGDFLVQGSETCARDYGIPGDGLTPDRYQTLRTEGRFGV